MPSSSRRIYRRFSTSRSRASSNGACCTAISIIKDYGSRFNLSTLTPQPFGRTLTDSFQFNSTQFARGPDTQINSAPALSLALLRMSPSFSSRAPSLRGSLLRSFSRSLSRARSGQGWTGDSGMDRVLREGQGIKGWTGY